MPRILNGHLTAQPPRTGHEQPAHGAVHLRQGRHHPVHQRRLRQLPARPPGRCHGPPHYGFHPRFRHPGGHRFRRAGTRRMAEHTGQRKEDPRQPHPAPRPGRARHRRVLPDPVRYPGTDAGTAPARGFPRQEGQFLRPAHQERPPGKPYHQFHPRQQPRHHGVQVLPAALRADRIAGPHPRRDRNRQRTGGQRNPHGEQPARRPFRQHQLRGHPEGAVRVGSLRLRARGLLRRAQGRQNRADRTGRSGHPVPRRSGGSSPARAGQAAPGAGGENPLPARIVAAPGRGFPACRRDQPRPQKNDRGGDVPRRPVLPHQPHDPQPSAPERARRGHPPDRARCPQPHGGRGSPVYGKRHERAHALSVARQHP